MKKYNITKFKKYILNQKYFNDAFNDTIIETVSTFRRMNQNFVLVKINNTNLISRGLCKVYNSGNGIGCPMFLKCSHNTSCINLNIFRELVEDKFFKSIPKLKGKLLI